MAKKKKSYNEILHDLQVQAIMSGKTNVSDKELAKQAKEEYLAPIKKASPTSKYNISSSNKSSTISPIRTTLSQAKAHKDKSAVEKHFGSVGKSILTGAKNVGNFVEKQIIEPIGDFGQNYKYGKLTEDLGMEAYKKMMGEDNEYDKFKRIHDDFLAKNPELTNDVQLLDQTIQTLPNSLGGLGAGIKRGGIGAALGAAGGAIIGGVGAALGTSGAGTPAGVVAGATTGAKWLGGAGYVTGSTDYTYKLESGLQYQTLIEMGVPEDIAKEESKDTGAINALIESGESILDLVTLGGISTLKTALSKGLAKKYGSKKVAEWIGESATKEGAKWVGKNVVRNAVSEGIEEGLQEATSIHNEKQAMERAGLERDDSQDKERIIQSGLAGGFAGGIIGGGTGVITGATKVGINTIQNKNQTDNTAQIQGLQQEIAKETEELNKTQDAREKQIRQEKIEQLNTELNEITNAQQITDENELRKQNFTYQAQETDSDIKKAIYESASQVMDNTQKSHKFVDVVAKIAEEKGTTYKFTNNEQLKQLGYTKENATVNGLVNENGEVLVNIDSKQGLDFIVGHETTHLLEGTKEYDALKQVAIEYAKSKGDYDTRIESLTKLYEGTNADIEAELTSDIVGEYLFTDENFIKELSVKQPTVFEKIKNFISDLVVKFKGTEQEKQLRQLQRSFEKAYKAQSTQTNTNTKYSLNDNQGRTLTKEQQEYFKDSKVRDEKGNLLEVYHSTGNYGFTEFSKKYFGTQQGSSLGNGFYFTSSRSTAEYYKDIAKDNGSKKTGTYTVYLDIKNPLSSKNYNAEEMKSRLDEIVKIANPQIDMNDFSYEYAYRPYVESKLDTFTGFVDYIKGYADTQGKLTTELFEQLGYDGIIDGNEYVVFNSNQIKNTDNTKPTSNPDIRYSLSEDGKMVDNKGNEVKLEAAETGTHGTLMAMHNLSDFKLKGILELGGFPVPSIAITKPSVNFTDYGEVSVIFDKETINPTNKQNEVYGSDVYSPRFPQTVNELNDAGVKKVAKILGMSDYEFEANYENMTIDDVVNRLIREEHVIDKYLESKNITVDPIYKTYSAEQSGVSKKFVENFLNAHEELKNNDINLRELDYEKYSDEVKQIYIDSLVQQGVSIEEAQDLYSNFEKADITKFLIDVKNFKKASSQGQQIDNYATKRAKEQHIDFYSDEYRSFVENLIAPAFGDKYIRNGKDLFTPSGNRRSFKQLHDAYNLENVVKNMKGKVRGEEGFFYGAGNIRSQVTPQFKSIAEIKANEGKLVTSEQMEEVKRDINSDLNNLSVTARNFGGHTYDSYEYALNEIAELKKITPDATRDILNENGFKNVPDILVQKSIEFLEKLKNAPTEYFEAKPQRAVGFDEVEAIVVPNNMSADLKQQLYDNGFNVIEYDPNIDGDRQAKINELDDLKFSLSAQNEEIAPIGNVFGKDLKVQVEEAIAPLQETIKDLTEQVKTIQENIVPEEPKEVAPQPTRPTLEEVQNLMNIKETQSGSDYARAFFALRDKYGQPNLYKSLNEYNKTGTIADVYNVESTTKPKNMTEEEYQKFLDTPTNKVFDDFDYSSHYGKIQEEAYNEVREIYNNAKNKNLMQELVKAYTTNEQADRIVTQDTTNKYMTKDKQGLNHYTNRGEIILTKQSIKDSLLSDLIERKGKYEGSILEGIDNYNNNTLDTAPVSQDIVEKQGQEAFKNITDNQAPSFEDVVDEAMWSEDFETTSTEHIPSPLDSRDIDEVGNRKVKAYQYENPEVKPYFQQEAQAMLGDLDSTIKGARTPVLDQDGYITGWYGIERQTTEAISYLKDKYGYSYEQIRQGLNKIIEDDGLENNAVSKRIEFMLDERLREGYTTSDGFPIPPNEEYINFLNEKQITEYNKEAFNALTDLDVPSDIAPEAQGFDLSQDLNASEQLIPMTEKVAQNQNMNEEYLAIAPEKSSEPRMVRVKEPQKLGKVEGRVTEPTIPEPVKDAKQLTLDGKEEDLVAKTKKQLRRELIEPNKEFFENALDNAKNRSMAFMNNTDTIRNTELVFGREAGKVINDAIFQKELDNEADSIAWQNKERQEIKDLGIKARSKESAAVQKYGEKQYVNEEGKLVPYGDAELAKEFPDIDTQNDIKRAAQVIRNKYDNYIDEANEVLTRLGFDPIKKRKDYMRHFQELTDVFSRNGIPFNAKNMQEHVLPTDINGLTEFWSPQKNYFASMQPRKGIKTNYDAITGIDGYISGISNLIFHTEDIQRGRAFEELIRETYGEAKGWENLEKLPDELKQARADKIQENHLSNYAAWVHEWTNNVAGKKNKLDRSVEATFGRKAFSVLDEIRKQVGSNMIGFNVSSSLTNLVAPVQAMSKTNKLAMVKGTADTIKNIFVKDNFVEKNKFLTSRFGTDMLSKNAWQKIQDAGFVFMKGTDWFTSNQIVRSKYYELRAKGLSDADAHTQAGQFAARIMGDRTKGAAPQLYNSKLVGLVTQFQLEVNNQLYSQFYDTYHESKENAKGNALRTAAGMTFTLGQLFAYTHLFGQTFESIAGYNPTFDVIEMIKTAFGWGEDEDEEKTTSERLKAAADQLVDALPYVNILTGGGRIPIASGIPNLVGVATGATDNYGNEITLEDELKKLLYLIPPTGGNQFKKTTQGLSMFDDDFPIAGSYTDSGNLRYTVEDNIPSKLQAGLFGKWANKNAQAYIDSDFQTIDKNNIEELVELGFDSNEYREYKKGLNEIKQMELEDGKSRMPELFDYIDSQDVTEEQKSIMIKHLLSEEETEDLSSLNMSTEQTIEYYEAKSNISQQIAEYANDKSLLAGDTESEEYKEAVSGLSDEKKSNIIDTIKNTNLTDEQKAYLYGKHYSSDKTLDKIKESGIDFDDFLTYSKDSLSLETTEDKAKYLYESNMTDDAKTVIYETSVLSGFDDEKKYKDYKVAKAVGVDINSWLSYKKQEFVADKDSDGDSIRGSRKDKIISYINSLELNIPQKAAMIRTEYSTFDDYNNDIVNYVNDLDLEYEEKIKVLENLDFTIGKDGYVYWD